ncbi:MAG: disulfide bond formation protein B [Henriciella sp.]|nr:disulfide bond formation protein B [Henriciella sp.]
MLDRLHPLLRTWRWPAIALLAALFMLGVAHVFERQFNYAPCPLCLRQREVYWAVAAMATTALLLWQVRQNPRFIMAVNVMLGLVFLTGTVVAGYHAGVEWGLLPAPSGCTAGTADVEAMTFDNLNAAQATASCTEAPFYVAGLSMAGWNAVASMALSVISFWAAGIVSGRRLELNPAE